MEKSSQLNRSTQDTERGQPSREGSASTLTHQSMGTDAERSSGRQGFASMDPQKQREIASKGGQSQGKDSNSGNFANNPERAREAGRKGGQS